MFGKRMKLFKLFDFEVRADLSWIVIAFLIAWSLSTGFFPFRYSGFSAGMYWLMGILGALGLFASVVVHEFAHSLIARRLGMRMQGITLFIFGGVAEMGGEPPGAKQEFLMAIVGPLSSFALSVLFYVLTALGAYGGWPIPIVGVLSYLAFINLMLAIFNLIPAFPLDGGRVFRSIIWGLKKDVRWATRISSGVGVLFGFLLIAYGFWNMFQANLFGGMWFVLIGMFLESAARSSYQQLLIRQMLEGESVRRFMRPEHSMISPNLTIGELVENYLYRNDHKVFPVSESGELKGCVTAQQVKDVPRGEWAGRSVGELAQPCSESETVDAQMDASELLSRISQTGSTRFIVVDGDRVVGTISLNDLMRSVTLKAELEKQGDGQ